MWWWRNRKKTDKDAVLILFGTKTGNARIVAQKARQYFIQNGIGANCLNMSDYDPRQLGSVKRLLAVVSTQGEGEPPVQAKKFYSTLMDSNIPELKHLNYSVCALGDSGYEWFCKAGRDLDQRLNQLGATPLLERTECDVDFSVAAVQWIKETCRKLNQNTNRQAAPIEALDIPDGNKSFKAKLVSQTRVNAEEAHDPVFRVRLKVANPEFSFQAGDSVSIKPVNHPDLVSEIMKKLYGTDQLSKSEVDSIQKQLQYKLELTNLSKGTLKRYQRVVENNALHALLSDNAQRLSYLKEANVNDLLNDFPGTITANQLMQVLPAIKERVYSIASAFDKESRQFDLLVKSIHYEYKQRLHQGAASVFLNEGLQVNDDLTFSLIENAQFRLPEDPQTPIILLAAGTGLAPFRAFLQQRQQLGIKNNCWLIWGTRHREHDRLCIDELTNFKKNGVIQHLNFVFSRDNQGFKYVQDVLFREQALVLDWLNRGAMLYVCGSMALGRGVKNNLNLVLQQTPFKDVESLQATNRYFTDLY
ncbi:MAG: flavodoxin domain-containing protein [Salinivirgaceae bacterium]